MSRAGLEPATHWLKARRILFTSRPICNFILKLHDFALYFEVSSCVIHGHDVPCCALLKCP
jgi:hypothetical protein